MSGATELLRHARHTSGGVAGPAIAPRDCWSPQPVDVVRVTAAEHPTRLALADRTAELTYAALDERIDLACQAMAEAGVVASTPIVLVVGNDVDSVVAVHAALRLDAVVLLVPRSAGADAGGRHPRPHRCRIRRGTELAGDQRGRAVGTVHLDRARRRRVRRGRTSSAAARGRRTVPRAVHLGHDVQAEGRGPLPEHADQVVGELHRRRWAWAPTTGSSSSARSRR